MNSITITKKGGCNCGSVRYELLGEPLFTHICHCRECQRSSGGAFNVSTVILVADLKFDNCTPDIHFIYSPNGNKYEAWCCDKCGCTLAGRNVLPTQTMVVRPGTLDDSSDLNPQAHIWTKEKQDWVEIPDYLPAFEENYDAALLWPKSSLDRVDST